MIFTTTFHKAILKKAISMFAISVLLLGITSCQNSRQQQADNGNQAIELEVAPVEMDLEEIKEKGKLVALTTYSPTSYFIYRGQPMGYEYELLQRLADHLDVKLEIKVAHNLNEVFDMLNRGYGDIVAHNLAITAKRKKIVDFTEHHHMVSQVLVQRRPDNWRRINPNKLERSLVRNPYELKDKTVHIRRNSSYFERLQNLSEEMGEPINVGEVPGELSTNTIIAKVAEGEYDFTVADKDIAMINATYYDNIDIETKISLPQKVAWAVRKTSPNLKGAVDKWLTSMKDKTVYYVIYNKYFKNRKGFGKRVSSDYSSLAGGQISPYDDLFYKYSDEINWDWRLLSAQAYQESHFKPNLTSWAGAVGLMQVLPTTAKSYGITKLQHPESNVRAGVRYLNYLIDFWEQIPDSTQRVKFVLASYNAGPGHVADARRLAEKYGKDPNIWEGNVDQYIKLKSQPKYYRDEVVRHGYCRGSEPYQYVKKIMERYEQYKLFIEEAPTDLQAAL